MPREYHDGVSTAQTIHELNDGQHQNGDGTGNKLGVMVDAVNTNIISSLTKLDTIATNTANIHIDVESVNLNVDTLEAKTLAISNGQTQDGAGGGNKLGVMTDAINTNTIAGNAKLDTIITNTAASSSSGLATETNLTSLKNSLTGDGVGGDNKPGVMLKAINDNIINTNTVALSGIDTTLEGIDTLLGDTQTANHTDLVALEASLTSIEGKIDTLDAVQDNALTKLGEIDTAIDTLDAVQDNALTKLTNIETLITTLDGVQDNALTKLGEIDTAIDTLDAVQDNALTKLTEIDTAVDAMSAKLPASLGQKANASSMSVCRTSTAGAYDLSARTTIGTAGTSTKLLCDAAGHLQVDVLSTASHEVSLHSTDRTHLSEIEGAVETLEGCVSGTSVNIIDPSKKIVDVAWMTSHTLSATTLDSTVLDTLGYREICVYGELTSGSVSGTSLMIQGSNASSGTYYGLGSLTNTTYQSGRTLFLDHDTSNGFGGRPFPRYLKIFNKHSGDIGATLRATMSDFYVYQ